MRPQWQWCLQNAAGRVLDRPTSPVFDARYDAEEWLGDHWRALSAQGVGTAVLLNEDTPVPPAVVIPAT